MIILVLLIALFVPSIVQAQGVWPNEPPGTVVMDCAMSARLTHPATTCGLMDYFNSTSLFNDPSAPVSPTGTFKSTIFAGNNTGGSSVSWSNPQVNRVIYVALMWRTNPEFFGRQVANKLFFVRGPVSNGFFGMMGGPGGGNAAGSPSFIMFGPNVGNLDNSHTCGGGGLTCFPNVGSGQVVPAGSWFKIEACLKSSTTNTSRDGAVVWWINGQPAGRYLNMNLSSQGLNEWVWSETWDGTVNPVPAQDWSHFVDHLRISIPSSQSACGATGGGGGADTTPPGQVGGITVTQVD